MKSSRSRKERAVELAIRAQHASQPRKARSASAVSSKSFAAILQLLGRFRIERERQGYTVEALAEKMGLTPAELALLESGKTLNPSIATLMRWAETLGLVLDLEPTAA